MTNELKNSSKILEVDLSSFPVGIYLVRLVTGERFYQGKVMLVK